MAKASPLLTISSSNVKRPLHIVRQISGIRAAGARRGVGKITGNALLHPHLRRWIRRHRLNRLWPSSAKDPDDHPHGEVRAGRPEGGTPVVEAGFHRRDPAAVDRTTARRAFRPGGGLIGDSRRRAAYPCRRPPGSRRKASSATTSTSGAPIGVSTTSGGSPGKPPGSQAGAIPVRGERPRPLRWPRLCVGKGRRRYPGCDVIDLLRGQPPLACRRGGRPGAGEPGRSTAARRGRSAPPAPRRPRRPPLRAVGRRARQAGTGWR